MSITPSNSLDTDTVKKVQSAREKVVEQLSHVIVGQSEVIDELLICLFSRGHCLLEGVPGLAKTLMISTLARSLNLSFARIQFTPDLMPADITGTEIIEENKTTGQREFRFLEGPLFANLILADEINRTPPKTQAALLEAMQERQATVGRVRHQLSDPFFVLATQNPIEQEGTYPLPEAQQDRFMFKVFVKYPTFDEEFEVARRTTMVQTDHIVPVLSGDEIIHLQQMVREVPVTDHIIRYALAAWYGKHEWVKRGIPDFITEQVRWGAGPRAVQYLILGGKARALLHGRTYVSTEDIQALARPVMRHRLVVSFSAESDGVTPDVVVDKLIETTPSKEDELTNDGRFKKYFHPEAIARIARLELRARHIVEGFMSGMHRSPYFGQSIEFLQHREYVPGDDLRHIDWKVWAKQDRMYIKQFEEETNLRCMMLVDTSSSMQFAAGPLNKFDYAATVATSLAYMLLRQHDAVGCVTFGEGVEAEVPVRSRENHLNLIVEALETSEQKAKTDFYDILRRVAEVYPRRGMVVLISDLLAPREPFLRGLRLLRQRGHDVMVFHVLDDDELDFPFDGSTRFEGLETADRLTCNPRALRDGYMAALGEFLEEVRHGCAREMVDYALMRTSDPLDSALASYMSNRLGMHHRN